MIIRRASETDAEALTDCIIAAYAPYRDLGIPAVEEGIIDDIMRHYVWVAEIDGALAGGVVVMLDGQAHIANLAVDPQAAGHGVGRALVARACAAAKAEGFTRIELATHRGMTGTLVFYRRLGWVLTGRDGNKVYLSKQLK